MKKFLEHIKLKNKRFICYSSDDEHETLNLTVTIHNQLNEGATKDELTLLKELMGINFNEDFSKLYQFHNGIELYKNEDTIGIIFHAISDLPKLNQQFQEDLLEFEEEDIYKFQKDGFAFGKVGHSSNYFVLYNNKVYYSDHDNLDEIILGDSFNDFLLKFIDNPAKLLYNLGCYTRYSDGITNSQYIPKKFLFKDI